MSDRGYSLAEQTLVAKAKELESKARELRKSANETRKVRVDEDYRAERERLRLKEEETKRAAEELRKKAEEARQRAAEKAKLEKEAFDDQVRLALSKISRALKDHGLKIQGNSWNSAGTPPFLLVEPKTGLRATVKVVEGFGWQW